MKMFDKLYAAAEAVVNGMNKPFRKKMLLRAAERVSDDLESKKIEAEQKKNDLLHTLANVSNEDEAIQVYKKIANLSREIEEAGALVLAVQSTKAALFDEEVSE